MGKRKEEGTGVKGIGSEGNEKGERDCSTEAGVHRSSKRRKGGKEERQEDREKR